MTDDPAVVIELPMPPRELAPNAGHHHMTKHKAKKRYKKDIENDLLVAAAEARARGVTLPLAPIVEAQYAFFIPRLNQDADNLVAQFKAGQDALKEAGFITEDNALRFRLLAPTVERCILGIPYVRVTLRGGAA